MKVPQTPEDLRKHLNEQLGFLRRSAESYDSGFVDEAKRLAVTIRILVHDTKNSNSLLQQLSEKQRSFYDTAMPHDPRNLLSQAALIQKAISPKGALYLPFLDDTPFTPKFVPFNDWWNRPIFQIGEGQILSRCNLVLSVANQDGGAHIDPALDEAYNRLTRENAMGWSIRSPELAAIRQIAHELIKTFDPSYEQHLELPEGAALFAGEVLRKATSEEIASQEQRQKNVRAGTFRRPLPKIGRNDPCPCGSGRKYKKCHGLT